MEIAKYTSGQFTLYISEPADVAVSTKDFPTTLEVVFSPGGIVPRFVIGGYLTEDSATDVSIDFEHSEQSYTGATGIVYDYPIEQYWLEAIRTGGTIRVRQNTPDNCLHFTHCAVNKFETSYMIVGMASDLLGSILDAQAKGQAIDIEKFLDRMLSIWSGPSKPTPVS